MANSINDLISNMSGFIYNPASIQRYSLNILNDAMNGDLDIVHPNNPMVQLLQVSAINTAAAASKSETVNRKVYPRSAITYDDIYPHMSDEDYIGRFASPSVGTFEILFNYEELLIKLVTDSTTGIRQLTIPRNTYFTVGDTVFSMQYPIDIKQLLHGGLNITYNTDITSPLQQLSTNIVPWEIVTSIDNTKLIKLTIAAQQFNITTLQESVVSSKETTITTTIPDSYYYARVYYRNNDNTWIELNTTHTDMTYDITVPTAILKVSGNVVTVRIPYIYISSGVVTNTIRADIYYTKGALTMDLGGYPITAFQANWNAIDSDRDLNSFVTPLLTFNEVSIMSSDSVNGGSAEKDFTTLRDQVIRNSVGKIDIPITPDQMATNLEDNGYAIVKNIETTTNRIFLATKALPIPSNTKLITAASASIETFTASFNDIKNNPNVINNGTSLTITPNAVFKTQNDIISMLGKDELDYINNLSVDSRALVISQGHYLYTPFYYVLDASSSTFGLRSYYLDDPVIESKVFIAENDTTLYQVVTSTYDVEKTTTGYIIKVATTSGDSFKELPDENVFAQLSFIPTGEKDRAYINGTLLGKSDDMERIYQFELDSTFNLDSSDEIDMTTFKMYDTSSRTVPMPLDLNFNITYSTNVGMTDAWKRSSVDDFLGTVLLPENTKGITNESLHVVFGEALTQLWSRSRSIVSAMTYQKWTVDVPATYSTDVYGVFDNGSTVNVVDGVVQTNLLHKAGDPVLDSNGNPLYIHRVGDVKLDPTTNEPIPVDSRSLIRQIDLLFIQGVYYFATDDASTSYRKEITDSLVSWISKDLVDLNKAALEKTKIYFYPKATMGTIDVIVDNGLKSTFDADQAFVVDLYLSDQNYKNSDLIQQLTTTTITTIGNYLTNDVLAVSELTDLLNDVYGNDVIGFKINGFGTGNYQTVSIVDNSKRLSIRKKLVAQADGKLIVQEDVTINPISHISNT